MVVQKLNIEVNRNHKRIFIIATSGRRSWFLQTPKSLKLSGAASIVERIAKAGYHIHSNRWVNTREKVA